MSENKKAKTPADGSMAWGCQCGRAYTVTCISSKPSKREWQGLTDEEVNELVAQFKRYTYVLLREVEAKLKEKNHG